MWKRPQRPLSSALKPSTPPDSALAASYPSELRELAERALERYFPQPDGYPRVLWEAMSYTLFAGGKRFRPVLHLAAGKAVSADAESLLPTACAIELVHTYSLIHDDLPAIDDDDFRRGRPTCHRVFGEDVAILAGDALFAEAFHLIGAKQQGDPKLVIRVLKELAEVSGVRGMVGGQVLDIRTPSEEATVEALRLIHLNKTAQLISFSVRSAAILAGAPETVTQALSSFGLHLGVAFQIVDDLLDVVGEQKDMGKTPGSDARKSKATYPQLLGVEAARKEAADEIRKAEREIDALDLRAGELRNLAGFVLSRSG